MKNYLYGFTIYSIQGYIFQTNKLKEIAGASELVEQICTTEFAKMIEKESFEKLKEDPKAIRNAAGNIRYLFDETQEGICKKIVRKFPKTVLDLAPGVQIGQAVVEIAENISPQEQQKKFKELEQKLTFQRSNPIRPVDLGYMSINRSRRTGLPSCGEKDKDGKPLDIAIFLKLKQAERSSRVSELFFGKYFDKEKITTDAVRAELHSYMIGTISAMGMYTYEIYANPDHVHILTTMSRTITIADMISKIKTSSSKWLKEKGIDGFGWQDGYGIFSVSASGVDTVTRYIQNQPVHHRTTGYKDELRWFYNKYGIEYDERYVWD